MRELHRVHRAALRHASAAWSSSRTSRTAAPSRAITCASPRCVMPPILPRRADRSPSTSPMYSLGHDHLDLHHRLEHAPGCALRAASLNAIEPAILNAISLESTSWYEPYDQLDLHVDHRIAGEDAVLQRLLDALLDRADVLARDRAADDLVLEDEALARLRRLHVDDDVAVLALAARLADELAFDLLDALPDRLAIGHLRAADVRVDLELAHHAVDDDLEVQLAHAGDDRLPRLGVGVHAERRIFLGQLLQRDRRACPGRPSSSARSRRR